MVHIPVRQSNFSNSYASRDLSFTRRKESSTPLLLAFTHMDSRRRVAV